MVPDFDPATRLNESLNAGAGRNLEAPPHERGRESVRNVGIGAWVEPRLIFNQQNFAAKIRKGGSELTTCVSSADNGKRPHAARSLVAMTLWDLEKDDVQADPTTLSGKADTAG